MARLYEGLWAYLNRIGLKCSDCLKSQAITLCAVPEAIVGALKELGKVAR
jgi:hypothetical protein